MQHEESNKYVSRLAAMANTRLLFNTIAELEEFLGNHAIKSNGIKRCYPTPPKLRSAYRDCKVEIELQTDGLFDLDWLMRHYERAWYFYKARFSRRKDPEGIAVKLLDAYYASLKGEKLIPKLNTLVKAIKRENVNPALLTLLLLKAIPGYDSKSGDVDDIDAQFERVLRFFQDFTKGCGIFDVLPVIKMAMEEKRRTRLMLIFHTLCILDTYEDFITPSNLGQANLNLKENCAELDMEGIWVEDDKKAFWSMKPTINVGIYFAIRYCYEDEHLLSLTRYTLFLVKGEGNRLTAYFLHPIAMKHRLSGRPYGDEDNAWYISDYPATTRPNKFAVVRTLPSDIWPYKIAMNRVTDPTQAERYEYEIQSFAKIDPYEVCNYEFRNTLYAITQEGVYVIDIKEECFYKLPRYNEHQFENLTIDSQVGILEIGPEGHRQRYLGIDERLLYIPLTPRHLNRYGIERTYEIE